MITKQKTVDQTYQQLLSDFFNKFPNIRLQVEANRTLEKLLSCKSLMPGKPGGWAGGILYAISSIGVGVPGVLNSELEEAFSVSMGTIYKRATKIREVLALPVSKTRVNCFQYRK